MNIRIPYTETIDGWVLVVASWGELPPAERLSEYLEARGIHEPPPAEAVRTWEGKRHGHDAYGYMLHGDFFLEHLQDLEVRSHLEMVQQMTMWLRDSPNAAAIRQALLDTRIDPNASYVAEMHDEQSNAMHGVLLSRDLRVFEFEVWWGQLPQSWTDSKLYTWREYTDEWRARPNEAYEHESINFVADVIRAGIPLEPEDPATKAG